MRKSVAFAISALMLISFSGAALADSGGVPNSNAFTGGNGNGRKAECVPPGSVLSQTTKDPGSNSITASQAVPMNCGVGNPS